jgi:hypothetical protein
VLWFDSTTTPFPPPPPIFRQKARSATHKKTENERQLPAGRGRGEGAGRLRESLALYKSFNPLCFCPTHGSVCTGSIVTRITLGCGKLIGGCTTVGLLLHVSVYSSQCSLLQVPLIHWGDVCAVGVHMYFLCEK